MRTVSLVPLGCALALCCVSGLADARGFVHASRVWQTEGIVWLELARSAAGFVVGMSVYWISTRFLQRLGISAPETQTLIWFTATIVGVAVASGRFARWPASDQLVACAAMIALGWLLVRQAAA
jgi:hypothetical protein